MIDLKVDFLAPVLDQIVFVKGIRVKTGRTIYLAETQMFDENEKLVAHGTSKLMAIKNKQTMSEVIDYVSAEKLPLKFLSECCVSYNSRRSWIDRFAWNSNQPNQKQGL